MASNRKDLVIITQPIHAPIDRDTVESVVPPDWHVKDIIEVCPDRFPLAEASSQDFVALAREQERLWRTTIEPRLSSIPDAAIGYFGLAPIPLAVHLGSLVERFRKVVVFHAHHETHEWYRTVSTPATVDAAALGCSESQAEAPVAITVSVTRPVDRTGFLNAVREVGATLNLQVSPCAEDNVGDRESHQIAREFSRMLQWIEEKRPRSKGIHLAAAVPCGVAFALGSQLTRTRHGRVFLYQYARPAHRNVLSIPLPSRVEVPLTPADIEQARELRTKWEAARQEALQHLPSAGENGWYSILGTAGQVFSHGRWNTLQALHQTPFVKKISDLGDDEPEFRLDARHGWILGPGLLCAMARRLKETDLPSAGRMLLFHEALHHGAQKLTGGNARMMRLHPRVLEEVDYLADVWAILHEFVFQDGIEAGWPAQRDLLCHLVSTALETMWAFDEAQAPGALEVRRISRYLLWYLNWAQLEQADNLTAALRVLAEKPIVDLVGPDTCIEDGRLLMRLDRPSREMPEIGVLKSSGEVKRIGPTPAFSPEELAQALGEHDGQRVKQLVRDLIAAW